MDSPPSSLCGSLVPLKRSVVIPHVLSGLSCPTSPEDVGCAVWRDCTCLALFRSCCPCKALLIKTLPDPPPGVVSLPVASGSPPCEACPHPPLFMVVFVSLTRNTGSLHSCHKPLCRGRQEGGREADNSVLGLCSSPSQNVLLLNSLHGGRLLPSGCPLPSRWLSGCFFVALRKASSLQEPQGRLMSLPSENTALLDPVSPSTNSPSFFVPRCL